jgi:nucleoside-diphosphate-sugar epimerase
MRVLIVGCGYVGLPLGAELVKQGHEVFGLRRSPGAEAELTSAGIKPLIGDITQPAQLAQLPASYDWVVNCVSASGGGVDEYRAVYLEGTRNLIAWLTRSFQTPVAADVSRRHLSSGENAPTDVGGYTLAAAASLKKFVYTSSTSVYGQNDGSLVKETSPTEPEAETAQILVETERVLLAAARERASRQVDALRTPEPQRTAAPLTRREGTLSPTEGERDGVRGPSVQPKFPAVILRLAGIYGPDRGYWFKQYLRDEARIEGTGARILNMIHRDDAVGAIIAALKSGRPGEVYNVVDDEPVTQLHFFQWLSGPLGKELPPSVPEDPEAVRKRGVTNKKVSNRRLKMELGCQFKYPTFRQGYTAEILRLDRTGELDGKKQTS